MEFPPLTWINEEHRGIYERTKHLPGWQDPGDSAKLYDLGFHHGDFILEIGVYGGRSAVVELLGARANPARTIPPCFLGVDLDLDAVARSYRSLAEFSLEQHAAIFQGTLQDLAGQMKLNPTMVFLDGDHSYDGVRADLATLNGFLAPGTPVLCHDYANGDNDTGKLGVRRAVDEFVAAGGARLEGVFGVSALLWFTAGTSPLAPAGTLKPQGFAALQHQLDVAVILRLDAIFQDVFRTRQESQAKLEKLRASHAQLRASYEKIKARLENKAPPPPRQGRSLWARALRWMGIGRSDDSSLS